MDVREKLVELIDDFIHSVDLKHWYSEELDEKLADDLISNGVTVQEWIPVAERLPLNDTYVNVTTDGIVAQAYWHNDRFYAFTAIGVAAVGGVTHWMPLPEPPKD